MAHNLVAAQPHFVPCPDVDDLHTDLLDSPSARAYVSEIIGRYFDPDFENLEVWGRLEKFGEKNLSIRAYEGNEIVRSVDVDSPFPGFVAIRAKEGRVVDSFRRDIEGNICAQWLQAGRFSPDFPIGAEVYWHSGGTLEIHVAPCF